MGSKKIYILISGLLLLFSIARAQSALEKMVRVNVANATASDIFKIIESQAATKIAYSNDILPTSKFTLDVKKPVAEVLEILFGKTITYELIAGIIVLQRLNTADPAQLNGLVTDENGFPLAGVSVIINGTSIGTSTDQTGKFSVPIREKNLRLNFSLIGYVATSIDIDNTRYLVITLKQSVKPLDEVIVVGFGTQRRSTVTGAVSVISGEEITQTPTASLQNALLGKLPGFYSQQRGGQPGKDGAEFFIRGISTYNGNQSPLILVDDIEFSYEDFSSINPADVQSLSILKDAATTAIYGIKGANGVVLVTTKRGFAGDAKIRFKTESGLQSATHVPRFLDAATTATLRNEALRNSGLAPEFSPRDIQLFRDGTDPFNHPNINWYNELFKKTSPLFNSNLDVTGGNENVKYFLSAGYLYQDGMLKDIRATDQIQNNYNFSRYNLRSNLDVRATRSLNLRLDLSGNRSTINTPRFSGFTGSGETAAFFEVLDYESLNPYIYNIYNPDGSYGYSAPNATQPLGGANNIIGRIANGGYSRTEKILFNINASANQKLSMITEGLEAKVLLAVSNSNAAQRRLNRVNFPSFYYDVSANRYIPRDASITRTDPFLLEYEGGAPRRQSTVQASLIYTRTFGKHNVNALALFNQNTKVLPQIQNNIQTYDTYIPLNFLGYTLRMGYDFQRKYLLEFNGSYNGTTRFDPSKRFGFFPAISLGWNLSEERFLAGSEILDMLKIRGSYGIVGSDDLGNFNNSYIDTYLRTGNYSFGTTNSPTGGIKPGTIGNPDVTWEKERKFNLGLDFAVLNGKFAGMIDVFSNKRFDILTQRRTLPLYFGLPGSSIPPENLGKVKNSGFEAELSYKGRAGKSFNYSFRGTWSYAKNEILEIDEVPQQYPWKVQTGQPIGTEPQWIWDGFYTAAEANDPEVPKYIGSTITTPGFLKYRDLNRDGVITDDDKGYFGKPNLPNTILSFNTTLAYKRLGANVLLQSALNYDVLVGYQFATPFKANLQAIHLNRWTPQTAETATFPTLIANFHGTYMSAASPSSFWAISGNYLRIKSVEVFYRIPEKFLKTIGLQSARLYANGYNLFSWSKTFSKYGFDPEVPRSSSSSTTNGIYPQQSIFNMGFNVLLN